MGSVERRPGFARSYCRPRMELSQALRSTGAVRDFTDDPVPDDVLYRVLDTARFAPNGGNRQAWHVIVVRDPATRVALRDLYLPAWYEYLPQMEAGLTPFAVVTDRDAEARGPRPGARVRRARRGRARLRRASPRGAGAAGAPRRPAQPRHPRPRPRPLHAGRRRLDLPVRVEPAPRRTRRRPRGRDHHRRHPRGARAAALFAIPEPVVVAGVLAFGYPAGKRATKLRRNPVESFATVDRYDGAPVTLPSYPGAGAELSVHDGEPRVG